MQLFGCTCSFSRQMARRTLFLERIKQDLKKLCDECLIELESRWAAAASIRCEHPVTVSGLKNPTGSKDRLPCKHCGGFPPQQLEGEPWPVRQNQEESNTEPHNEVDEHPGRQHTRRTVMQPTIPQPT